MIAAASLGARKLAGHPCLRRGGPVASSLISKSSTLADANIDSFSDRCNLNIVSSPYPDIKEGPYVPIAEFVTQRWAPNGYLENEVAIIDGTTGLSRTFADFYNCTRNLAGALKEDMGIDEDSTVALYSPNHVDYLPICLAVSLAGAKLAPINPLYTPSELGTILDRSEASVLITHERGLDTALEAAKNCEGVKHVVVITDDENAPVPEGTVNLASLKNHDSPMEGTVHEIHQKTDWHPLLLPYSSGTTGMPKGVLLTHKNLVANLLQLEEVEELSFPSSHKLISPLPFYHIYGFLVSMLYCAWQGQQVITMSGRFDLETFCQLVQEHQPQRSHLVPPILLGLAKSPIVDKYDLGSLQTIISAAAPLSKDIEDSVVKRLDCSVKQGWGMSELSPIGTFNSDFNNRPGSVGPLVPMTHGKIVDEAGNSLPPNKSGELMIKGPQVMLGYIDDPEKTRECLSETGWLRTGDVAHYDEDGYFYITDRIKELIKVRGYQVAPAELEALLLTHDDVVDAAVIQIPDEEAGELPRAYVVTSDGAAVTEDDIYQWVKDQVSPHKRLDGGVIFTDVIPKSASGKILRRILRDQVASEK